MLYAGPSLVYIMTDIIMVILRIIKERGREGEREREREREGGRKRER